MCGVHDLTGGQPLAEAPEHAIDLALKLRLIGARYVFAILYRPVEDAVLKAFLEGKGPAPWVAPERKWLERKAGCSRTQLYEHLKALEDLGLIVPEDRDVRGERLRGWVLPICEEIGLAPEDELSRQTRGSDRVGDGSQAGRLREIGSGRADSPAERTVISIVDDDIISPVGGTAERPPSLGGTSKPAGDSVSGPPRRTEPFAINQFVSNNNEFNRPASLASSQVFSGRTANNGRRRAIALVEELATYEPSDPNRRFKVTDPAHIDLAEALLCVDWLEKDNVDVFKFADERFEDVRSTCRDYRTICETNWHDEERWWRPRMLSLKLKGSASESPWAATEGKVKEWRRERDERVKTGRAEEARAIEAEAKAVADRLAEMAHLAKHGDPALSDFARELRAAKLHLTGVCTIEETRDRKADHQAALEAVRAAKEAGRRPTLEEINAAVRAVPALERP